MASFAEGIQRACEVFKISGLFDKQIHIFAIIKRNHFKMYMFGVVRETHAHDYFEDAKLCVISIWIIQKMHDAMSLCNVTS